MSDQFDDFEIKAEKLIWSVFGQSFKATTSRGVYTIRRGGHLDFLPTDSYTVLHIGKFKNPKARARKHFNEEAL